jgi:phosphate starvation-inducible protein PhoH
MGGQKRRKLTPDEENEVLEYINEGYNNDILGKLRIDVKSKTPNQKKLINEIKNKEVVICSGYAGSGKTYLSCAMALELLKKDPKFHKIVLVKSVTTLKDEEIGFLKGPQPLYEKVLTPNGWVKMGELSVGDFVISEKGNPVKILEVFDQENSLESDIYRITLNDGRFADSCINHIWNVKTNDLDYFNVDTKFILNNYKNVNLYLPSVKPIESLGEYEVPINPYLLGILISNGKISSNNVRFRSSSRDITNKIVSILNDYSASIDTQVVSDFVNDNLIIEHDNNEISNALIKLGICDIDRNKLFIPEVYIRNNIEVRTKLLKGLLDGNSKTMTNGEIQYRSPSKKVTDAISDIVLSLGGNVIKMSKGSDNYQIIKIRFSDKHFIPFNCQDKIKSYKNYEGQLNKIQKVEKIGTSKIRCIKVDSDSGLYITKDYIVTHNTMEEKMRPFMYSFIHNFEKIIGKANVNSLKGAGMIEELPIAYMRGINIDNSIVIIDEVQNITVDNIRTILTRLGQDSKMILLGDDNQIDLKNKSTSSLSMVIDKFKDVDEVGTVVLTEEDIVRNPLIKKIEEIFREKP